jgi:HTH-type transcriptional regulator/antitoxin HipB
MKTYSLEELTDQYIGKKGSLKRDEFENELRLDLLGQTIKKVRLDRNLTQEQLGEIAIRLTSYQPGIIERLLHVTNKKQ